MAERLDADEIRDRLPDGWQYVDDEIARQYEFDDYLAGVAFASEVGEIAEEEFHHPTITIRYKEVEVAFTTHDAGGVTEQDLDLAAEVDAIR